MKTDMMFNRFPIQRITRDEPLYPQRMRGLSSMPGALYLRGCFPSEDRPTVGIIGARLCSPYGHRTAYEFAGELAKSGVQIVSGMASGIDGYAAEGALDAGCPAWAVLGSGVDVCYPASNHRIYEGMMERGGIISELEPGSEPLPYHFPARNRIISALSDLLLVVEARQRSGSLITVDFALSQGKTVYAVPGRVGDRLSDGCNALIADGAGIASSVKVILEELGLKRKERSKKEQEERIMREEARRRRLEARISGLNTAELLVLSMLSKEEPVRPDALVSALQLPFATVITSLQELVRAGLATEETRGCFLLTHERIS